MNEYTLREATLRATLLTVALLGFVASGCAGTPRQSAPEAAALPLDFGGRVVDKFYAVEGHKPFVPDRKTTAGTADGLGGKHNDGAACDCDGKTILNDDGHDYRIKNYFGWDLKGVEGIYGPDFKNKKSVRPENLMTSKMSADELYKWFATGQAAGLPVYGHLVKPSHLRAAVDFIVAVRDGKLPRADDVWTLAKGSAGGYKLNGGADVAAGKANIAGKCAMCHGTDGTRIGLHGGDLSLGSFVRGKSYEAWFKVLAGHAGSQMKGQVPAGLPRKEAAKFILDTLAALCDRAAFPKLADGRDVEDGDPRCGAYLK